MIAYVLQSLEGQKLRRTQLSNKANLDSRATSKYISFLLRKNLIRKCEDSSFYEITERGKAFMKSYWDIMEILQVNTSASDGSPITYFN